jgi:hypothetical protein
MGRFEVHVDVDVGVDRVDMQGLLRAEGTGGSSWSVEEGSRRR